MAPGPHPFLGAQALPFNLLVFLTVDLAMIFALAYEMLADLMGRKAWKDLHNLLSLPLTSAIAIRTCMTNLLKDKRHMNQSRIVHLSQMKFA